MNDAPVALDPSFGSISEDVSFSGTLGTTPLDFIKFATDVDSSLSTTSFNFTKVTFKGTELSSLDAAGIKYNPTTGAFKFDPSSIELYQKLRSTESGDVVVSFRVTDGSLSDDGTVTFTVTGVNDEQECR